ncbi:AtpZ/AtpI family protein [Polymorphobacter sp.]|uniref:AtpZ/AtpI family protein n=1 Tax=Polymorphobacter sp. TaxID=1909290 RepID=UPI003F71150C
MATEFVGAMLAGGFIGWFIDRQFGSGPWGLIVMLLLGFATGLRSVLRKQSQEDEE